VRDCFVLGGGYFINPDLRLYGETGYAFNIDGGAKPWEFQFGIEFSPAAPSRPYDLAAPFFAVNSRLRQEVDWGGNITVQAGIQWRGRNGHLARLGLQYFNGMSDYYQFLQTHEEKIGLGAWYDF
jgi:hypothetical protein